MQLRTFDSQSLRVHSYGTALDLFFFFFFFFACSYSYLLGLSWDVPGDPSVIPLGCTGQSPSPTCPGMSLEIPGHPAWLHRAQSPSPKCPERSRDIPLGCTGHKVPVLSVLGCPREILGHPASALGTKSQS